MTALFNARDPAVSARAGTAIALAAAVWLSAGPAFAQERVVIATTGGAYETALREAWFDPFTAETGIEVVTVAATGGEMRAQAKAMTETNNVTWDLYFEGEIQAGSEDHKLVAEDLTEFCEQFSGRADLAANSCTSSGARVAAGATLMAYNAEAYGDSAPQTWADMWDTTKYPGGRAFPNFDDPWRVLAAALLADGVAKNDLFPLDLDRAFNKLDEIRPEVTLWWKTGDQSVQGFRNNDYSIGQIWLTRANALKTEGQPVGWSYEAAFLVGDRVTLIKGAPNPDAALKLVAYWLDHPKAQAGVCEVMLCTPPSADAIALMSDSARAAMPTSEQVQDYVVIPDADWINSNQAAMLERWNSWIQ